MTYYNGNVYAEPVSKWAHDGCLPDDQFTTVMLADFTTGRTDPVTGYRVYDYVPHRHQIEPWRWSPVWGAPEPCSYCGQPVS